MRLMDYYVCYECMSVLVGPETDIGISDKRVETIERMNRNFMRRNSLFFLEDSVSLSEKNSSWPCDICQNKRLGKRFKIIYHQS